MAIPIVTATSLIAKGYPVSTLKSEGQITLADSDIKDAYFPSTELFADEKTVDLLHALVYSLLLRRKIVLTRYGSVEKNLAYSVRAEEDAITSEIRGYCASRLEKYYLTINIPNPIKPYFDYYLNLTIYPPLNKFEYDDILKIYDIFLR